MNTFCSEFDIVKYNDIIASNSTYTYIHEGLQQTSYIDYFLISKSLSNNIVSNLVLVNEVNMSDHCPIVLVTKMNNFKSDLPMSSDESKSSSINCLRWDHADLARYYEASYSSLLPIFDKLDMAYKSSASVDCSYGTLNCNQRSVICTQIDEIMIT